MKIGVSSYSFIRLVQTGAMTQLDVIVKAKEIGFDVIEFSAIVVPDGHTLPDYAKALREEADRVGIEIVNYTIGADFLRGSNGDLQAEIARVQAEVDIAEVLGVPGMRHDASSGWPADHTGPKSFEAAIPRLAEGCRAVTEYAAEKGIKTMVENHGWFCQESVRVEQLVTAVDHPNFGVLIDMGNFLCADDDPVIAVSRLMPYAFHCHAKDFHVKPGTDVSPGEGWFGTRAGNYLRGAIIGHGNVPILQCLRIMHRDGFAGLQERYVREWLGAMAGGGIVDYDAATQTYRLPPEHRGLLIRAAGTLNLANSCQMVAMLGEVETDVVDSFKNGGGVPYSKYPAFQTLMAEISTQRFDGALLDQTVPLIPGAVDAMNTGVEVADVGCGSGHAVNLMANAFPNSRFTGFDISEMGIQRARAEAEAMGNTNTEFVQLDVSQLAESNRFEIMTSFDAIHDQAHPDSVLSGIYNALAPGGRYLCVEPRASSNLEDNIKDPMSPYMYTVSTMHCMTVSLSAGGEGLGAVWGEQTTIARLQRAGFADIEVKNVDVDRSNNYYVTQK